MSRSHANCIMREEMNPLDLLAEVAVSCSDDEKGDKIQHSDDYMEPEAEFNKLSPVSVSPVTNMTCDNNNLAPTEVAHVKKVVDVPVQNKENVDTNDSSEMDIESSSQPTGDDSTTTDYCQDSNAVTEDNCKKVDVKINGKNINEMSVRRGTLDTTEGVPQPPADSSKSLSSGVTLVGNCITSNETKPTYKVNVSETNPVTSGSPATQSVAQQVSRLLSPNFKLTMTDNMPSILQSKRVSSLLIGSLGSATIRSALAPTTIIHRPQIPLKQKPAIRKQPNISISAIPWQYPLLDHDYCYQNYCAIAQASSKLMKERIAAKKLAAKQSKLDQKTTDITLNSDSKPVKRKYRTKKIIAQELEAARRLSLEQKAKEGDQQAKLELSEIEKLESEQQEKEANKLKRRLSKKRQSSSSTGGESVDMDSDEEIANEIAGDVDDVDPVIDHNPAFKDQFVYFGSKKYKSKRRHINKEVDPYESFWRTGVLENTGTDRQRVVEQPLSPPSEQPMENTLPPDLMLNASEEINDVFDVLGISSSERQGTAYGSDDVVTEEWPDLMNYVINADSDILTGGSCSHDTDAAHPTDCDGDTQTVEHVCGANVDGVIASGKAIIDGLDELLQGITMEEVSELIVALDVGKGLNMDRSSAGQVSYNAANEKNTEGDNCEEHSVKSLSTLAKQVCSANNIPVTAVSDTADGSQTFSQQSHASNMSIDITDADILSSDKNINLDLLNALSVTPPKPIRPDSLPTSKSSPHQVELQIPSEISPVKTESTSSRSPVVVPVTMYWNTFPALLLDGVKYVRLIDISRQALPSKETGLLKKRAQALGYDVTNCTDLQRNLLVRYAYACQSRSTLMVTEACAAKVIASYMEKSEIEELSKAPELPSQQLPSKVTSTTTTNVRAPAEPVTLMPQVLIEHKPLQQSSHTNSKSPTAALEPVVPERSSRLRQIKSSYRRFLSLGSTPSTANTTNSNTTTVATDISGCTEENASDRGYHSDQSPDSLNERPVNAKKAKRSRDGKFSKKGSKPSARRSLSTSEDAVATKEADVGEEESKDEDVLKVELAGVVKLEPVISIDKTADSTQLGSLNNNSISHDDSSLADELTVDDDSVDMMSPSPPPDDIIPNSESMAKGSLSASMLPLTNSTEVVHIRHIDLVARRNGTALSQDGDLYMQFFTSLHSPCIRCCTCSQYYTLKAFTKHQHHNDKLVPVKVRQRIESTGLSADSDSWQIFKKKKQLFETTRTPLQRLSKPDTNPITRHINTTDAAATTGNRIATPELGKRIPKQKKYNPDEVYYTNPCILSTTRKRKAESTLNGDHIGLKKRVER